MSNYRLTQACMHFVIFAVVAAISPDSVGADNQALGSATSMSSKHSTVPKPNIVFILADDMGYGELGCYGQKQIRTPRLDQMAAEGVRFSQFYSGSAVCAPSRAALLTGLTTGHTSIRKNGRTIFRDDEKTIADMLRGKGYRTALVGKWGFASAEGEGAPEKHGFDESLAYLTHTQAHDYTPEVLWKNGRKIDVTSGTYAPDLFTTTALDFLSRAADKPFFLFLSYTTPHAHNALARETGNGMEVPDDAPYSNEPWPQPQKNHAAMITRMDSQVGQVLDKLKELGLDEKTIVFFSSDNGPHREGGAKPEFFDSNGILRGIKRDLYDGGIRVPMIVRWPGTIQPKRVSESLNAFWDILPTAAELTGATMLGKTDGISLVPELLDKDGPKHEFLYWELQDKSKLGSYQGEQRAVRMGKWKAVRRGKGTELYDLSTDPGERNNVAASNKDIVARAEELFESARTAPDAEATTQSAKKRKQ